MPKSVEPDILHEPHKPQFASAPEQARKTATVEEAYAAASELKVHVGTVRALAKRRRSEVAVLGKNALPPDPWDIR